MSSINDLLVAHLNRLASNPVGASAEDISRISNSIKSREYDTGCWHKPKSGEWRKPETRDFRTDQFVLYKK